MRSHSCKNCPCACRECSKETTKSSESKTASLCVNNLTSVPDTGHHDCDGKTYDICKRYSFTLHNELYFIVPKDDLKPYGDVKSGIDENGKIEAATVSSLTSVPDTGHHDCDGKT